MSVQPVAQDISDAAANLPDDFIAETVRPPRSPGDPKAVDMTDVGNAILFCQLYGENLRWVRQWKKWIRWTGIYWKPMATEAVVAHYAQPMVQDKMPAMAKKIVNNDVCVRWLKWVATSNAANRVHAMLDMAGPRLMVEVEDLNANPDLFATRNAVLSLQTCLQVPARREDYITVATPVSYDAAATCPRFEQFLREIIIDDAGNPAPDVIAYLQRMFGYFLTPSTKEQLLFIAHGAKGKNGKSTLMETILQVVGEYGIQGSDSLYFDTRDRSNNEDEARLYTKRLCVTAEVKADSFFNSQKIKKLTGSDRVVASYKYASQFEFTPTHKLILICNNVPRFDPTDTAMIRRIKLIPFLNQIPEKKRDHDMAAKLAAEQSGILNWMLAGLVQWNSGHGLGDEHTPDIMKVKKDSYLVENDDLNEFINANFTLSFGPGATKDDTYSRYKQWCEESGKRPLNKKNLSTRMESRGWKEVRSHGGIRRWQDQHLVIPQTEAQMVERLIRS